MISGDEELATLVEALGAANESSLPALYAAAYDRLHDLARTQRRHWQGQETLSTTALVHEAYLKLSRQDGPRWRDRSHFFRLAARAMRHILIDYAERSRAAKRGGGAVALSVDQVPLPQDSRVEELLALDEALSGLARQHPRQAQVVECRFFLGLEVEETAEALGVSPATVMRDWRRGKAWLHVQLQPARSGGPVEGGDPARGRRSGPRLSSPA